MQFLFVSAQNLLIYSCITHFTCLYHLHTSIAMDNLIIITNLVGNIFKRTLSGAFLRENKQNMKGALLQCLAGGGGYLK